MSCFECGTALLPTPQAANREPARVASSPTVPQLDASRATRILAIVLVAATVGGLIAGAVGALIFVGQGHDFRDRRQERHFERTIADPITAVMMIVGGIAMLRATRSLPREILSDGSPIGAAWVLGSRKRILEGLCLGALLGLTAAILSHYHRPLGGPAPFGLARIFAAVVLAPVVEELLFRGLLYGGYRRSFGPVWAGVLTTVIFCFGHAEKIAQNPLPATVSVVGGSLGALWFRLRSRAIGPAVATHFACNAAITLVFFLE